MDYVDLFIGLAVVLVLAGFAWCFGITWQVWKEDCARAGGLGSKKEDVAPNQQPRAVSWEEFDRLSSKVAELEKWAYQDHIDDKQMWESIKILDFKVGVRFSIKRVETTLYFDNSAPTIRVGRSGSFSWQDGVKEIEKISFDNPHLGLAKVQRDGNPVWVSTIPVCSNSENRWLVSYELEAITL